MKKITYREIEQKTGISKSTVALALNDRYGVNAKTRAKVLLAAYELGYDFKKHYEKIGKKMKKIALLIAYDSCISEVHWKEVITEIERNVIENDCVLEIFNFTQYPYKKLVYELQKEGYLGAVIIHHNENELMSALNEGNIKCVVIEPKYLLNGEFAAFMPNDYQASGKAAKYFYDSGHRNICFFGNIFHNDTFLQRYNGFYDYFRRKKDVNLRCVIGSNRKYELQNSDFDEFHELFSKEDRPTALMCANDALAVESVHILQKEGIRIPQDVSVIGFGNTNEIYDCDPVLTSIRFDRSLFGKFVSDYLIKNKYGNDVRFNFQISADIIENGSTRRL